VRAESFVFQPPFSNQHLGLFQGIKGLAVEQFIPKLADEALILAILPWAARLI
jgi:hypothetical protein